MSLPFWLRFCCKCCCSVVAGLFGALPCFVRVCSMFFSFSTQTLGPASVRQVDAEAVATAFREVAPQAGRRPQEGVEPWGPRMVVFQTLHCYRGSFQSYSSQGSPSFQGIKNPGETAGFCEERWLKLKRMGSQPLEGATFVVQKGQQRNTMHLGGSRFLAKPILLQAREVILECDVFLKHKGGGC